MTRIVLAAISGAIVYFIWQMLAWMLIPLHGPTVLELPGEMEANILEALTAQELASGVYLVPNGTDAEMADAESDFARRHRSGPIFSLFYSHEGSDVMPPSMLVTGFAIDVAAAFIVVLLLSCTGNCCQSYWRRVGFVGAFGVFLALSGHMSYYNWMRFPADFTIAFVVDVVTGWFLAGIPIAAIMRPAAPTVELN